MTQETPEEFIASGSPPVRELVQGARHVKITTLADLERPNPRALIEEAVTFKP